MMTIIHMDIFKKEERNRERDFIMSSKSSFILPHMCPIYKITKRPIRMMCVVYVCANQHYFSVLSIFFSVGILTMFVSNCFSNRLIKHTFQVLMAVYVCIFCCWFTHFSCFIIQETGLYHHGQVRCVFLLFVQ